MGDLDTFLQGQYQEISRGSVVIAVLWSLREPQYGYALLDQLNAVGIQVEANTLYPLLRRLELQGLLESSWNTEESRPRKYYRTSEAGSRAVTQLLSAWRKVSTSLSNLTGEDMS
ncbi:MAG TPA: PadR family transcriptional regulator [Thermomicrobiales bacterium]|nr:PadR family transcriptional regulator [Thermomicrobiales bacterium]